MQTRDITRRQILPIILSGGWSKRLNGAHHLLQQCYPKQFLSLLSQYSLLQETLLRLRQRSELFLSPLIATNLNFNYIVKQQLANIGYKSGIIVLEPHCKDTGPAITAALLAAVRRYSPNQLVAIFPSDHYFANFADIANMMDIIANDISITSDNLITFGMEPTEPDNDQYGYIHKGSPIQRIDTANLEKLKAKIHTSNSPNIGYAINNIYRSHHFIEKPKKHIAKKMTHSGKFLWNMGIYMGSINTLLQAIHHHSYDTYVICEQAIKQAVIQSQEPADNDNIDIIQPHGDLYSLLKSISIDRAISEKMQNFLVANIKTTWHDLGSLRSINDMINSVEKLQLPLEKSELLKVVIQFSVNNSMNKQAIKS